MIFSEMFQTKLNAMIYARCLWNTEGKNRMQLMKGHMPLISKTTGVRYDVCVFESNTLPREQVNIPENNGIKMFELDGDTYNRLASSKFFFLEVVSQNQALNPNFAFQTLEEAQRFASGYQRDTRSLDVMFRHLEQDAAMKLPPQPARVVSRPSAEPQERGEEKPAEMREETAAAESQPSSAEAAPEEAVIQEEQTAEQEPKQKPLIPNQPPVNMTAYDRFCLDLTGIEKRQLMRFRFSFVSPVSKAQYDAVILESRSKKCEDVVIPEVDGKPVAPFDEASYREIENRTFFFVEISENGRVLVPNLIFEKFEDAKRYLYGFKADTRGPDVMFRHLTQEEAVKLAEPQPARTAKEAEAEESAAAEEAAREKEQEEAAAEEAAREKEQEEAAAEEAARVKEQEEAAEADAEIQTPPISMAVYSRFCLDTGEGEKDDLCRYTADYVSTQTGTHYEVRVYLGKSKKPELVKIPEINGKLLFDLPAEEYASLSRRRFYFIEVSSDGQTTVLNKIFASLDAARSYIAAYEEDIRELDVMFRRVTPREAAAGGAVAGKIWTPEEEPSEEKAEEPTAEEAEEPDEEIEEQTVETKTYVDENGDEVEEEIVTVTKTLFEDDDEEEEYIDEEYTEDGEADDTEFVGDGEEEYREEADEARDEPEQPETRRVKREVAAAGEAGASQSDKLILDGGAGGGVIYNQPIYAKEVYIQFPDHFSSVSAGVYGDRDLCSSVNQRGGYNEVDFERYMDEVNRAAETDEFGDLMKSAEEDDPFKEDFFDAEADPFEEYSRRFGGDDTEDVFSGILGGKRGKTDDYDDVMRLFRSDEEKEDDFWDSI